MTRADDTVTEDDGSAVLSRAWPEGVPSAEAALLKRLPVARRQKVVARLTALLDIEDLRRANKVARLDLPARARTAGVTTDGLAAIRRKWDADRTLASVVPYLGRSERQPTQRSDDDPIVVEARALIADRPGATDSQLASELRRRGGASVPNMIRLVRRLRRDEATDPSVIGVTYGKALLVDVCATDAVTAADRPIAFALVVERASRLILGAAAGTVDDDTIALELRAVSAATARIAADGLDADAGGTVAAVELTIGDGPGVDAAFAAADVLREVGFDVRANSRGPRRYGQRLVSLLGRRLGAISWRPRSSTRGAEAPPGAIRMDLSAAHGLLDLEVDRHNAEILANLGEGRVLTARVMDGAMARALVQVTSILSGDGVDAGGG